MNKLTFTFLLLVLYAVQTGAQTINITGAAGSENFGKTVTVLTNGNYVVTDPLYDDGAVADVGAVYLYNGITHALISTLKGSTAGDGVGQSIFALPNGNYVVRSQNWDNGAATNAGAVTWGSGTTGVSGVVSSSNSLVGSTTSDQIANGEINVLTNGNYVVRSSLWDNGAAVSAGAITWGSGTTGVSGVVSSSNSLVGSVSNDNIGSNAIITLTNGNYVVRSIAWNNGAVVDAGSVTWGSGTTGVSGVVSSSNSLVGSVTNDFVGSGTIFPLTNGNYVVRSSNWDNGGVVDAGAVTWGNGATGTSGAVSSANSLVGSTLSDQVSSGVVPLTNGNYVVYSPLWDNGAVANVGAVTWCNGATGTSGAVSSANSLVGSTASDNVGTTGVTALTNGNYVVRSANWDNGAVANAGAVTWGNGTTGTSGAVSSANSLVGSTASDNVGSNGVNALTNGNYVVRSNNWDNGAVANTGAVTWGNGTTGISGAVSSANSLVGSTTTDNIGLGGVTLLTNGNYVVISQNWDNGAVANAGAATWGNGTTGVSGVVSSANSLVGSTASDAIGSVGITSLNNGNYVVLSINWDNGAVVNAGAVTWGNGTTGVNGIISSSNSLLGSTANDNIGNGGATALTNGNYVVQSQNWDNGAVADAGAATWGNGTTGIIGIISSSNSLVGSTATDNVATGVTALTNGNYVVRSPNWNNGAVADAGAATWGNGTTGITGIISSCNSLVGSTATDNVSTSVTALTNGNYVVNSPLWNNGAVADAGAVTWGKGSTGVQDVITSCNSVMGTTASGGSVITNAQNYTYDYLIVGRPVDNIVSIFIPDGLTLAVTLDAITRNICGTAPIPLIASAGCRIIATLTPNGGSPISGSTTARVWIEGAVPTHATEPFVARHYEITPTTGAATATGIVTLYFTQTEFDNFNAHAGSVLNLPTAPADVAGIANLRVGKYPGSSGDGSGLPASYTGSPVAIDPVDGDIVWNITLSRWEVSFNVTGFSGFIIQTSLFLLPSKLLNFYAVFNNNDVQVSWKTTDEVNMHSFEVERSLDGRSYAKVGTVAAFNTTGSHQYNYTDAGVAITMSRLYYRLKQIDNDGKFTYSRIVLLPRSKNSSIAIYPIPAGDVITLSFSNRNLLNTVATIRDMQGRQVKQFTINNYQEQIDISRLSKGMYVLMLMDGTAVTLTKN